jgi:hypothetical protein
MATLNITYHGVSADLPGTIDDRLDDREIRRLAAEAVASGGVPGLHIAGIDINAFARFVVDRFAAPDGKTRVYLRPKVPFGAYGGSARR